MNFNLAGLKRIIFLLALVIANSIANSGVTFAFANDAAIPLSPTENSDEYEAARAKRNGTGNVGKDNEIKISPTENLEAYEQARRERRHDSTQASWAGQLNVIPKAFRTVDFRVPTGTNAQNAANSNISLGFERFVFQGLGIASIGLEGVLYGSFWPRDNFGSTRAMMYGLGPYATYQAHLIDQQILVPFAKVRFSEMHYRYSFNNPVSGTGYLVNGFVGDLRYEAGLMFFMNFINPSSKDDMRMNYKITRTYLYAGFGKDKGIGPQKDFALVDRSWTGGIRFEF